MSGELKTDGLVVAMPQALEGIDLKKFTVPTFELNPDKSFDQNLMCLFGISADEAAEIIKFALALELPITGKPIVENAANGGKRKKLKGGVGLGAIVQAGTAAYLALQNINTVVTQVSSAISYVDSASNAFVKTSELRRTAEIWRKKMDEHCPEVVNVPTKCSYLDMKCKIFEPDIKGTEQADFMYNSEMCTTATKRYTDAVSSLPKAEADAIKDLGTSTSKIVNIANIIGLTPSDIEKLKKGGIVNDDGKVLHAEKYADYLNKKYTPDEPSPTARPSATPGSQVSSTAQPSATQQPVSSSFGAQPSSSGGKNKKKKTKKRVSKRRITRRKARFVY